MKNSRLTNYFSGNHFMDSLYGLISVKNPLQEVFSINIQNSEFTSSENNLNIQNYLLLTEGTLKIDIHDCFFSNNSVI